MKHVTLFLSLHNWKKIFKVIWISGESVDVKKITGIFFYLRSHVLIPKTLEFASGVAIQNFVSGYLQHSLD
jgi:hypothetical protein